MKQLKRLAAAALAAAALTAALGAAGASATTLEVGGVTKNESVTITASLKSGTSLILRDTFGFLIKTCTGSHLHGSTESPYTGATVTAPLTAGSNGWSFTSCTSPVVVHDSGKLHIAHIANTTNGTVTSSGFDATTDSVFGTLTCTTGTGTHLGTLTGKASGHAELHINATLNCGVSAKFIATYTVTSPTGPGVSS